MNKLKCQKCKVEQDEHNTIFKAFFSAHSNEMIEVQARCDSCDNVIYTFIPFKEFNN